MVKKRKFTNDVFVESLSPKELNAFKEDYKDLVLSELIMALMEEDAVSVRKLAKIAGISPTIVQGMRSGTQDNFSMQSFFKIIKGLGGKVVIERNGHYLPLDISPLDKK